METAPFAPQRRLASAMAASASSWSNTSWRSIEGKLWTHPPCAQDLTDLLLGDGFRGLLERRFLVADARRSVGEVLLQIAEKPQLTAQRGEQSAVLLLQLV